MPGAAHRLNKKEYQVRAVALLAAGEKQTVVAKKLGVSQPTISKFARREDIKPLIEQAAELLIREGLAPAIDMVLDTLHETLEQGVRDNDHNNTKNLLYLRKLGLQVAENILKSAGVFPTHAQAPVIQNIVVGSEQVLAPAVRELLMAQSKLALPPRGE
ncbi:hypothetical protein MUP29_06995 [bacterium]|nr:hypothetical protein [bacterium]